ncbi:MAG: hypothetical protein FJ261_01835 [Planctomycetes bacterium]|nr:hypothetical protein [Planctomycetota bacterium]
MSGKLPKTGDAYSFRPCRRSALLTPNSEDIPNNGASLFTTIRTADPVNFRINHSSGLLPASVFSNQVGPVRLSLASFQFLRGAAWRASCHRKTVNRQADEA